MIETNQLYLDDCFKVLPKIDDKSVDLVLTDPPYGLDWRKMKQIELHGRKAFLHNYEELKDFDSISMKDLYKQLFPELNRIVKDTGSILLFARTELITWALDCAWENELDVKCVIAWHKTNPMPQIRKVNYLSSIESIIWMARWHPTKCLFTFNFKMQNEMHNFIELPLCGGGERTSHPTQKPEKLIQKLLEVHSNPGDLVVDPFMGSGTTCVVAERLGRKYIGVELNPDYYAISHGRLTAEKNQLSLPMEQEVPHVVDTKVSDDSEALELEF